MKLRFVRSYTVRVVAACTILMASPSFAQSLADEIPNPTAGNWTYVQTISLAGREVPQFTLSDTECRTEADTELTIGQYFEKFVQGVGPDQNCTISEPAGSLGNVRVDVSCTNPAGAKTDMVLTYTYSSTDVSVLGEGTVSAGGTISPIQIVATSQYVGSCN